MLCFKGLRVGYFDRIIWVSSDVLSMNFEYVVSEGAVMSWKIRLLARNNPKYVISSLHSGSVWEPVVLEVAKIRCYLQANVVNKYVPIWYHFMS